MHCIHTHRDAVILLAIGSHSPVFSNNLQNLLVEFRRCILIVLYHATHGLSIGDRLSYSLSFLPGFRISALRDHKSETSRVCDLGLFAVLSLLLSIVLMTPFFALQHGPHTHLRCLCNLQLASRPTQLFVPTYVFHHEKRPPNTLACHNVSCGWSLIWIQVASLFHSDHAFEPSLNTASEPCKNPAISGPFLGSDSRSSGSSGLGRSLVGVAVSCHMQ